MDATSVSHRPEAAQNGTAPDPIEKLLTDLAPGELIKATLGVQCVQAQRFDLIDKDGKVRGGMVFTDEGRPAMVLGDRSPGDRFRVRAELVLTDEGPVLELHGERQRSIRLVMKDSVGGYLIVQDSAKRPRLAFGLDDDKRGTRVRATQWDKRARAWTFVRREDDNAAMAKAWDHTWDTRLTPLVQAGKRRAFMAAMSEVMGVYDSRDLADLWKLAREKSRLRRAPRAGRRSREAQA